MANKRNGNKNKSDQAEQPAPAPEPEESDNLEERIQAAVSAALISAAGVHIPEQWCQRVQCTLPGYEQLTVVFRVNNRFDVAERYRRKPIDAPIIESNKIESLFILRFEGWDFKDELTGEPIPAPTPTDPSSYELLYDRFYDLLMWCRRKGYDEALSTMFVIRNGPN